MEEFAPVEKLGIGDEGTGVLEVFGPLVEGEGGEDGGESVGEEGDVLGRSHLPTEVKPPLREGGGGSGGGLHPEVAPEGGAGGGNDGAELGVVGEGGDDVRRPADGEPGFFDGEGMEIFIVAVVADLGGEAVEFGCEAGEEGGQVPGVVGGSEFFEGEADDFAGLVDGGDAIAQFRSPQICPIRRGGEALVFKNIVVIDDHRRAPAIGRTPERRGGILTDEALAIAPYQPLPAGG